MDKVAWMVLYVWEDEVDTLNFALLDVSKEREEMRNIWTIHFKDVIFLGILLWVDR